MYIFIFKLVLTLTVSIAATTQSSPVLHNAVNKGDLVAVETLLNDGHGIDERNSDGETVLHLAVKNGHVAIVKWLIDHGASVKALDSNKRTPLFGASQPDVAQVLIDQGAEVDEIDKLGFTPLQKAILSGFDIKQIEVLLKAKADVNRPFPPDDGYLLFVAIERNDLPLLKLLVKSGANTNVTFDGRTPIDWATMHSADDAKKYLISLEPI